MMNKIKEEITNIVVEEGRGDLGEVLKARLGQQLDSQRESLLLKIIGNVYQIEDDYSKYQLKDNNTKNQNSNKVIIHNSSSTNFENKHTALVDLENESE